MMRHTGDTPHTSAISRKGAPSMEIRAGPMGMGISRTKTTRLITRVMSHTGMASGADWNKRPTSQWLTPFSVKAPPRVIMVPTRKNEDQLTVSVNSRQERISILGRNRKAKPTIPTTVMFKTGNQEERIHRVKRISTSTSTYRSRKSMRLGMSISRT